jgi:hypothetical protein
MKNTNEQLVVIVAALDRLARNQSALADVVDRLAKPGGESSLRLSEVRGEAKEIRDALSALQAP